MTDYDWSDAYRQSLHRRYGRQQTGRLIVQHLRAVEKRLAQDVETIADLRRQLADERGYRQGLERTLERAVFGLRGPMRREVLELLSMGASYFEDEEGAA